jgi:phosphoribosylglycinamide formyltransferase-1
MKNLVIVISGRGLNAEALIRHCQAGHIPARVCAVISNRAEVEGLVRARRLGVATEVIEHTAFNTREAFDVALAQAIEAHRPDIVALAGFMRILGDGFVRHFRGRLLNVHPSLLPMYPGIDTHARVLAAGDARHGATVHYVTEQLDGGPAIIQGELIVLPQDTPQTLADRVMKEVELKIYPQAVAWAARGQVELVDDRIWTGNFPLRHPWSLADVAATFQ